MRLPVLLSVLLVPLALLHAQAPEAFQYQAVARDAGGDALTNTTVGVQFQLHQTTAAGAVVFAETHAPTTNANGLFTVEVGHGTPSAGTFSAIDWSAGPYFLEVGLDPAAGSSYVSMGTQQLLSVPYALHATDVANKDDADADPANELQTISFANDSLQLSQNGGKVDLSTLRADDDWVQTGDTLHNNGKRVGIGTATPSADLDVEGTMQLKDGTQGDKRLLTGDADGNASWQDLNAESIFGSGNVPAPDLSCLGVTGSVSIGSNTSSVTVSDDFAYVVDATDGDLRVIDISDPTAPFQTSNLSIGPEPRYVAVSGDHAYVVDATDGDLKVIDISDPNAPVQVGSLAVGGDPVCVALQGNYAYVVNSGTDDLQVIDISDPSAPTLSGSLGLGTWPVRLAVSGNHAYVVDWNTDDLKVIDISDPMAPALSGSLGIGTYPISVAVSGDHVYVVDFGSQDLKVIDVSDPSAPALSGSLGIGSHPNSVSLSGHYACVADAISADLKVIDISDPAAPLLANSLGLGTGAGPVAVSGDHAYVADGGADELNVIELFCGDHYTVSYDPVTGELIPQLVDPNTPAFTTTGNVTSNATGDYATDAFVFGSPQLADDGDADHDNRMFFDKSKGAFRAGQATDAQWDDANVANGSIAMGMNATASGDHSTALGSDATASGPFATAMGSSLEANGIFSTAIGRTSYASAYASTAMGINTIASGNYATALGKNTTASGGNSTAMGTDVSAVSGYETVMGRYNTAYTAANTTGWNVTDRLFVIGNGTASTLRSNALTIYKDGRMNINDAYDMPTADGGSGQVLTTNGGGVASWQTSGLGDHTATQNIRLNNYWLSNDGGNEGVRIDNSGRVGIGTSANSYAPLYVYGTTDASLADASGVMVVGDIDAGNLVLDGNEVEARYNGATTPLRFQADGGDVGIGLTTSVDEKLHVNGNVRATGYRCRTGVNGSYGGNIFNVNWTGMAAQLYIDDQNIGTFISASDRRLKDHIDPMPTGAIARVEQLRPVSFRYKNVAGTIFTGNDMLFEGFIADELQAVIPSAVNGAKDALNADGTVQPQTVNNTPIISVLTKAVQEQQALIEEQQRQIDALQEQLAAADAAHTARLKANAELLQELKAEWDVRSSR